MKSTAQRAPHKTLLLVFISLFLGALGGVLGTAYWYEQTRKQLQQYASELATLQYLAFEGEEAYEPYREGRLEAALYAANHYKKILEFYRDQHLGLQLVNRQVLASDLTLVLIRLGNMYERQNEHHKARQCFQQAIHVAKDLGSEKTIEEWRTFVARIDEDPREYKRTTTGPWIIPKSPP